MNWERFISVETAERLVAVLCHSLWQAALLAAVAARRVPLAPRG